MDKAKKHYWGIVQNAEALFTGSFSECWDELLFRFEDCTVYQLKIRGISIKRIN